METTSSASLARRLDMPGSRHRSGNREIDRRDLVYNRW